MVDKPALQVQMLDPATELLPVGHVRHAKDEEAPVSALNLFRGHKAQIGCVSPIAKTPKLPGRQGVHFMVVRPLPLNICE